MLTAGWFWLTIAIGIFWALGAYNRLMRLQSQVQQCFDALELRLLEFTELVQQVLSEVVISAAPWRSELNHDQGASHWSRLQESARHLAMELARMQEHPLRADSVERVRQSQLELQAAWESLVAPSAYRVAVSEVLQQRWQAQLLLVQPDTQRFNQAVEQYNQAIDEFPAVLMARLFKFMPGFVL
jgi:LemA protein